MNASLRNLELKRALNESIALGLVPSALPGPLLGRFVVALTRTMVNGRSIANVLAHDESTAGDFSIRAIVGAADSSTYPDTLTTEIASVIEELAASVPLLQLNATELGMTQSSNARRYPIVTGTTTAAFVAEGAPIPARAGAFGNGVTVDPLRKIASLAGFTSELLTWGDAANVIQSMLIRSLSQGINSVSLSANAATAAAPAGLFHAVNAAAPIASTNLAADVYAVAAAIAANFDLRGASWVLNNATALKIANAKNAAGGSEFPSAQEGVLLGSRILTSAAMPVTRIALMADAEILRTVIIDPAQTSVSADASAHMDSAPGEVGGASTPVASAWQTDSLIARAIGWAMWRSRHLQAVQHAVVAW